VSPPFSSAINTQNARPVLHVRGIWYANSVFTAQNPILGMSASSAISNAIPNVTYNIFMVYISFFIVQIGYISLDTYPIFNPFI
jgi:hypothetical protein